MSPRRTPRLAVNPIAYWLRDGKIDRSRPVLEEAFRHFQQLGYKAVKADLPAEMTTDEYLTWIGSYGLAPSVSLFNSALFSASGPTPGIWCGRALILQR